MKEFEGYELIQEEREKGVLPGMLNGVSLDATNVSAFKFVENVKERLSNIFNEFIEIGKLLENAQRCEYYKQLGFNSLGELSEKLFNLKKSTAYNLINLYIECSDGKELLPKYKGYNQSQLVELISVKSMPDKFLEITSPEDASKKIRKARKIWQENNGELDVDNIKSVDDLIEKYSRRLENNEGGQASDNEDKENIQQKINMLKMLKAFMEQNNCVCFIAPKSDRRARKNSKFLAMFENFIGGNV